MVHKAIKLPPEIMSIIYSHADHTSKFHLSRVSKVCHGLWGKDLVSNVGHLLVKHPSNRFGFTMLTRELKHKQHWVDCSSLWCMTFRVSICPEALGQFLCLSAMKRRVAAAPFISHLLVEHHRVWEQLAISMPQVRPYLTIMIQHDAKLRTCDYVALEDLLMVLPMSIDAEMLYHNTLGLDTQWWLCSSTCQDKRSMPWAVGHWFGHDVTENEVEPVYLDSTIAFK